MEDLVAKIRKTKKVSQNYSQKTPKEAPKAQNRKIGTILGKKDKKDD